MWFRKTDSKDSLRPGHGFPVRNEIQSRRLPKTMYLGTVTGTVVSTVKDETLEGRKLLLVRRRHDGKTVVAVDSVGAGVGERVYVCRGREASFAFRPDSVPSDATIVGIVDLIDEDR